MSHQKFLSNSLLLATALGGLILWAAVLYTNGMQGPFTFDDVLVFPSTQLSSLSYESVMQAIAMHNSGIFGRPLPVLSFILNHHVLGADPFGYKLVNFIIHAINTFLVFVLVSKLAGVVNRNQNKPISDNQVLFTAVAVTALWAIHPLQISSVLYIFQRMTLLSSLFTLLALISYVHARTLNLENKQSNSLLFVLFPLFLILAIISKENGALIIPYMLLIEFLVFWKKDVNSRYSNALKLFFILFLIVPVIGAVVYFATHTDTILEGYGNRDFTMLDRLRTEMVVLVFYLKLIVLPNVSDMSLYHDAFPRYRQLDLTVITSAALLGLMALCVFLLRKKATILSLGLGFFLVAHSLESTFIPLELVFEHRNYLALLGIVLPAAWYTSVALNKMQTRKVGWIAFAIPFLIISGQTYSRSLEWSDELLMNTLAVENKPDSLRARNILITTLSNYEKHDQATDLLIESKQRFPERPALHLLGLAAECNAGQLSSSNIEITASLLARKPLSQDVPNVFNALLQMASAKVCDDLTFELLSSLTEISTANAIKVMPDVFEGNLFAIDAQLKLVLGRQVEATDSLEAALEIVPNHPEILIVLIHQLIELDRIQDANDYLDRLTTINTRKHNAYDAALANLQASLSSRNVLSEDTGS